MQRFAPRPVRLLICLLLLSFGVSGCFQTAGASIEATQPGSAPIIPAATETLVVILPTVEPTLDTGVPPTEVVFEEPTPIPPEDTFEEPTPIPDDAFDQPTDASGAQPNAGFAEQPTETPFVIAQEPTLANNDPFGGGPQATQTAVQSTLFAQATQIIASVTADASFNLTATATAQGTGMPGDEGNPNVAPTLAPDGNNNGGFAPANSTPQGTPGAPGSGAAGPVSGSCIYTVVEGDRIFRIALRFGMTPESLARANGIVNFDLIVPGQQIRIPNCNGTPIPTMTPTFGTGGAATATPGGSGTTGGSVNSGQTYIVREGDTLFAIARRYGVKVAALAQTNNISNINLIYIGQSLIIP